MKKNKKIKLNSKEINYLEGLLEAQRCKIEILDKKHQKSKTLREDLKTADRIERKLAFE
jgi:predicted site-specific integrase-resolvase